MTKPIESRPWAAKPRRSRRLYVLLGTLVSIVLVAGASLWYLSSSSGPSNSTMPTTVSIDLGSVTLGRVPCGGSTSLYSETIPWIASTQNLTTADLSFQIREIGDGDVIGTNSPPATVSASNLCVANPPSANYAWYLVLGQPHGGAYDAVFTYVDSWSSVNNAPLPVPILPASTLVIVSASSLSSTGYALEISGVVNGPALTGYSGP